MKNPRSIQALRGFTLAELAIVLVIVALLGSGLIVSLSSQRDIQAQTETNRQLNEAIEAILGFATANGRLPRPAVSATDGTERGTCASESDCAGFLPWQVLGVKKTDSWGKLVRYSVTPAFANSVISLTTIATKKVLSRDSSGNTIYVVGQAASCSTGNPCTPAVIFSHGKQRFGTDDSGIALPGGTATSIDEASNDTGTVNAGPAGTQYMTRTFTDNTVAVGGEFDDQVIWLSPNIIFNRLIAAGRLP